MAVRPCMSCASCGSMRPLATFQPAGPYDMRYGVNYFGGRGRSRWEFSDLPLDLARLQLARLDTARAQLAALIAEAERG